MPGCASVEADSLSSCVDSDKKLTRPGRRRPSSKSGGAADHDARPAKRPTRESRLTHGLETTRTGTLSELLRRLHYVQAPRILLQIMAQLWHAYDGKELLCPTYDALETFAGAMNVTKALRDRGLLAVGFEKRLHPLHHDFLSSHGFLHALTLAMRLEDGAFTMHAPVCSSWVWINRSVSLRTISFPLGDRSNASVEAGNIMVSRLVLLVLVLLSRGCWVVIEQPLNSVMQYHPRFQWMLQVHSWWRIVLDMGAFGADTQKPTVLFSSKEIIRGINGLRTR